MNRLVSDSIKRGRNEPGARGAGKLGGGRLRNGVRISLAFRRSDIEVVETRVVSEGALVLGVL